MANGTWRLWEESPYDVAMGNRYEGIRRLGTGGMADVYLARMSSAGGFSKLVALKQMRADLAAVPEAQALFLREVSLGARISHPFVAQVLDGGKVGDRLFMITEYVDGGDLRQFVTAAGRDWALPAEAVCAIGMQLCDALSFVYGLRDEKGGRLVLAHRDIYRATCWCRARAWSSCRTGAWCGSRT